jgi:hypothetical protein
MKKKSFWMGLAAICGVTAGAIAVPAKATQIFDPLGSATVINSGATILSGTVTGRPGAAGFNAEAFTVEVFARAGECLRLDVLSAGADLAMGAASPSPLVYFRDDDSGIGLNPQIRINPVRFTGWHSVNIGSWNAAQNVYADFTMAIGRYNGNNPNCASPTPASGGAARSAKSGSAGQGPAGGTR